MNARLFLSKKHPVFFIMPESVGCKLIYLPPYSPDLNPIEKFWANMKKWIKNNIAETKQLSKTIDCFFKIPNSM
jgi:transposase